MHVRKKVEEPEDLEEGAQKGVTAEDEEDAEAEAGGRAQLLAVRKEAEHARGAEVEREAEDEAQLCDGGDGGRESACGFVIIVGGDGGANVYTCVHTYM